jgi:hypothetical protein
VPVEEEEEEEEERKRRRKKKKNKLNIWTVSTNLGSWFDPRQTQEIFLFSECPDKLWDQHILLFSGYRGYFPLGNVART